MSFKAGLVSRMSSETHPEKPCLEKQHEKTKKLSEFSVIQVSVTYKINLLILVMK